MSVGGSLGASKSKSSSSTNATRELEVTDIINRLSEKGREGLDGLIDYLGSAMLEGQSAAMAEAKEKNKLLTREQALEDSAGAVSEIMKNSAQEIFPSLFKQTQGSGAYNSTTAQLMADNKQAEAAAKGAAIQAGTIANYEALSQQNLELAMTSDNTKTADFIKALGLDSDATAVNTRLEEEEGTSTSKGKSSSLSAGISGSLSF